MTTFMESTRGQTFNPIFFPEISIDILTPPLRAGLSR